jgi:two-component system, OmpR family, response regulator
MLIRAWKGSMATSEHPSARLLIVEDDPIMHELLVRVTRRAGHEPVSACTGEQALSILRHGTEAVDWLLTDIRLPGSIDGWAIGSEFTLKDPMRPVIYVSGIEEDCSRRRSIASIFLRKPVNVADLVSSFRRFSSCAEHGSMTQG